MEPWKKRKEREKTPRHQRVHTQDIVTAVEEEKKKRKKKERKKERKKRKKKKEREKEKEKEGEEGEEETDPAKPSRTPPVIPNPSMCAP